MLAHATLHADYDFVRARITENSIPTRNLRIKPRDCPAKSRLDGRDRRNRPDKRPVLRQMPFTPGPMARAHPPLNWRSPVAGASPGRRASVRLLTQERRGVEILDGR